MSATDDYFGFLAELMSWGAHECPTDADADVADADSSINTKAPIEEDPSC